jgi:hypothetical protein
MAWDEATSDKTVYRIHIRRNYFSGPRDPHCASVITTKSATDQVLIFLLTSSLLLSRVAKAMLLRRALI